MILFDDSAVADLELIKTEFGLAESLRILEWCARLDEPATRLDAERLSSTKELLRLRVDDFNIIFTQHDDFEVIEITKIRLRTR